MKTKNDPHVTEQPEDIARGSSSATLLAELHAKKETLYREMNDAWAEVDRVTDEAIEAEEQYAKAYQAWADECERLVG